MIQRFEFDMILGFSHDIYPVVFAHVTRESGITVLKHLLACRSQAAGGLRNIFADVTTNIGIQGVDAKRS